MNLETSKTGAAAIISALLEYATRFAEQNNEPVNGNCRRSVEAGQALVAHMAAGTSDGVPVPVIVLEANGGAYHCVRSSAPARLIILDEDVQNSDKECILEVNGEDHWVGDYHLTAQAEPGQGGIDAAFVLNVAEQIQSTATVDATTAFEVTAEDVERVLHDYALRVNNPAGQSFTDLAAEILTKIDRSRIEKAALDSGCELEEQTLGAQKEIKTILVETGVLEF